MEDELFDAYQDYLLEFGELPHKDMDDDTPDEEFIAKIRKAIDTKVPMETVYEDGVDY